MKSPLQDLWDSVVPLDGPGPAPRPHAVLQQVNTSLDAVPSERKRHMRQKIRAAAILVAAVLALTGSALAVAQNWTVLDAFFGGSSEAGEALMDTQPHSVEDDNYILTVTSSAADDSIAYLVLTVEAKTPQAVQALMADDFENMDTWAFTSPPTEEDEESGVSICSVGTSEEENLRTDTSRTWGMEMMLGTTPETVSIRLNAMEEGLWLEVPLTLAQSVTVTIGAKGTGAGTLEHADGGPVTLEAVTLTPLGLTLDYTYPAACESRPVPAFLKTDGTLYSWSQLVSDLSKGGSSHRDGDVVTLSSNHAFRTVQNLSELEAVVFEGIAYPLDGSKSYEVDVSGLPTPFQLELKEPLNNKMGFAVSVRALCDGLGASCVWDNASRSAILTFRDVTIILTEGETTALVNGKTVELSAAPDIRDGCLDADCLVFLDAWSLDLCAAMENRDEGLDQRAAWVVIP